MIELKYRPFCSLDELTDFNCGIEEMDAFIHSPRFLDSLKEQECVAYIVRDESERVVGLFALNMDILDLDDYDKDDLTHGYLRADAPNFKTQKEFEEFMSQPRFKVVDIAYLAVCEDLRKKGVGTAIMEKIFGLAGEMNPDGWFMTVDALYLPKRPYSAVEFYEKFHFQRMLPPRTDTIRMYRTMR